jgi:hypothetical protein
VLLTSHECNESQEESSIMSETVPQSEFGFPANPTVQDIFKIRMFEELLGPIGANPTPPENSALVAAILDYSKRIGPADFSSLTEFLEAYPKSSWNVGLLTNLGIEYYKVGRYSKECADHTPSHS